jgi:hypothetical protein
MSPNLNAYAERFARSIKDECLNEMIFIGQGRYAEPWPNSMAIIENAAIRALKTD